LGFVRQHALVHQLPVALVQGRGEVPHPIQEHPAQLAVAHALLRALAARWDEVAEFTAALVSPHGGIEGLVALRQALFHVRHVRFAHLEALREQAGAPPRSPAARAPRFSLVSRKKSLR